MHGPDEFDAPLTLALPAKIEAASFVAAVSSYCRSQLMRWSAPDQWDKIGIIRCGVDRGFLDAEAIPVPPDCTEFVCVARLSAQKGLPLLIAACDRLRANGERFSLSIIGDGEPIMLPPESSQVEHEGEIGVIIGRRLRRVTSTEARGAIQSCLRRS